MFPKSSNFAVAWRSRGVSCISPHASKGVMLNRFLCRDAAMIDALYATIPVKAFKNLLPRFVAKPHNSPDLKVRNFRYYKFRSDVSSGGCMNASVRLQRYALSWWASGIVGADGRAFFAARHVAMPSRVNPSMQRRFWNRSLSHARVPICGK